MYKSQVNCVNSEFQHKLHQFIRDTPSLFMVLSDFCLIIEMLISILKHQKANKQILKSAKLGKDREKLLQKIISSQEKIQAWRMMIYADVLKKDLELSEQQEQERQLQVGEIYSVILE
jgi:hypothetical protein